MSIFAAVVLESWGITDPDDDDYEDPSKMIGLVLEQQMVEYNKYLRPQT